MKKIFCTCAAMAVAGALLLTATLEHPAAQSATGRYGLPPGVIAESTWKAPRRADGQPDDHSREDKVTRAAGYFSRRCR